MKMKAMLWISFLCISSMALGLKEIPIIGLDNEEVQVVERKETKRPSRDLADYVDERWIYREPEVKVETAFEKADRLFQEGRYEQANTAFRENLSDKRALFGAATTDRFLGNYERAIREYGDLLAQDAGFAEAYLGRGLAYRNQGNYESAIGDLKKYISLTEGEEGYLALGDIYMALGKYSKAESILSKGRAKHPTSNMLRKMLAQTYLQKK